MGHHDRGGVGLVLGLVGALSSCSSEKVEPKPQAPEMKSAVAALTHPTATLNKTLVASVVKQVFDTHDLLSKTGIQHPVSKAMIAIEAGSSAKQSDTLEHPVSPGVELSDYAEPQAFSVNGGGWVKLTRICDGWGPEPSPNPENGTMVLNAGFTEKGLDPVVWGQLYACKYPVQLDETTSYDVLLDGANDTSLSIYIGDAVSFAGVHIQPFIAVLDATLTINGTKVPLKTTLRYDYKEKTLDFALTVSTGTVAARVTGADTFALRGANASLACNRTTRACTTADGQDISF